MISLLIDLGTVVPALASKDFMNPDERTIQWRIKQMNPQEALEVVNDFLQL